MLFQENQGELVKVRASYESKLTEAEDKYADLIAANEELKMRVEVLFKLGKNLADNQATSKVDNSTPNTQMAPTLAAPREEVAMNTDDH